MHAQDIEAHLADLGQELQDLGVEHPVRILMIGGAFMLTQVSNRSTTDDVDILLKDVDDPTISPLYQMFKTAVQAVASRNQLSITWINDVIADFIRNLGTVPEGVLWQTYGMLEVYIPPREYILALKLLAGRQKDRGDIQALCQQLYIQTPDQAQQIVDRYIPEKEVQQLSGLDDTISDIFS
jgi:hypothetical protein